MTQRKAESVVLTSAVFVFAVWAFRSLYEAGQATAQPQSRPATASAGELVGLAAHPAHPAQFLVGFGFVYFMLSITASAAPKFASNFAVLIAVGDGLANGLGVFTDIGKATSAATTVEAGSTTEVLANSSSTVRPVAHAENQKARSRA